MDNNIDSFKVITIGDAGVGKTSIIRRYVHDIFDDNTMSTVGVAFAYKEVQLDKDNKILLRLIDTAGQEKYKSLSKSYFKNCDAVLFVFDLSIQDTFNSINDWISTFNDNNSGKDLPKYLIGNKCDLPSEVEENKIETFLSEHKEFKYYKTSAKRKETIDALFVDIANKLYNIYNNNNNKKKGQVLQKITQHKEKKKCCITKADI